MNRKNLSKRILYSNSKVDPWTCAENQLDNTFWRVREHFLRQVEEPIYDQAVELVEDMVRLQLLKLAG